MTVVLNLLGLATVILALGLIFVGRWVRPEAMTRAIIAQIVAMVCIIIAGFILGY